jgi:hypothetical protein
MKLDSAFCNQISRGVLVRLFSDRIFCLKEKITFSSAIEQHLFNSWVRRRFIKLEHLKLNKIWISLSGSLLSRVKSLSLSHISGESADQFTFLINSSVDLESLKLDNIKSLPDVFDKFIIKNLTELTLKSHHGHHGVCSDILHKTAANFCYLKRLQIDKIHGDCNETDIINIVLNNRNLEFIDIYNSNYTVGDMLIQTISKSLIHVKEIHFRKCLPINLDSIVDLSINCKALEFMTIVDIEGLRQQFRIMNEVYGHLSRLRRTVRIDGFDYTSKSDKKHFFSHLNNFYVLWMEHFVFTDDMILCSLKNFQHLRILAIDSCGGFFTKTCLVELVIQCKKLRKIYLTHCHLNNDELIEILTTENSLEQIGFSNQLGLDLNTLCMIVSLNIDLAGMFIKQCPSVDDIDLETNLQMYNKNVQLCTIESIMYA